MEPLGELTFHKDGILLPIICWQLLIQYLLLEMHYFDFCFSLLSKGIPFPSFHPRWNIGKLTCVWLDGWGRNSGACAGLSCQCPVLCVISC